MNKNRNKSKLEKLINMRCCLYASCCYIITAIGDACKPLYVNSLDINSHLRQLYIGFGFYRKGISIN